MAEPAPISGARTRKVTHRQAALILAEQDPVLARLLEEAGLPRFPVPTESNFATLVRSVVYQQLAGASARAIHGRLITALGGEVTPERMLALSPEALRAVGLSTRKVASLRDLADKVLDGTVVLDARRLARVSDEEIVARLSTVRGIGKWSAEIFLMFQLRRMDVWPTGDLAIRKGYGLAWGISTPTIRQLDALGEPYRPYRTVLSWYCWRAAQLYGASAASAVTA
jgi:DNA-3-methyladenine glycosylase II